VAAPHDNRLPSIATAGGATVTLPSECEIEIVRRFDAPRAVVFDAWTRAEQIAAWWDPRRRPLAACDVDLRPGGAFRFVPQGPVGEAHPFEGYYREIAPPARLVFATPGPSPGSETIGTLVFEEREGQTTLTITMLCATRSDRDALLRARVDTGTVQTLDNLHAYLASGSSRTRHPLPF
jgi:uncharacterized protein YndB with AHSA1/START domain